MLHVYRVESLYATVVDTYVDWQTAIVETVIRAAMSGDQATHLCGHERRVSALASLLQFTQDCDFTPPPSGELLEAEARP